MFLPSHDSNAGDLCSSEDIPMNTFYHLNLSPLPLVVDYILSPAIHSLPPLQRGYIPSHVAVWLAAPASPWKNMVPSHCHVWPCNQLWPMGVNVTQPYLGTTVQNKFKIRLYLLLFSLCFENNMFQIGSVPSTWLYVKKIRRADP